jgi:hypothetical protein
MREVNFFEPGGHMFKRILAPALLSSVLLITACGHRKDEKKKEISDTSAYSIPVTQEGLDQVTESWPVPSKAAIKSLTEKYGLPAAVTDDMVVWNNTQPFKRSIIYREEVNQMFPMQHSDVLQQTVDYRVPLDRVDDLSRFDGSIMVDRTKGELSTRNDREEMNILSLNLADKIIKGEMTVEEARRDYSKNAEALAAGTTSPMLSGLIFTPESGTADPDTMMQSQESIKEGQTIRKTMESEKVEEVLEK